MRKSISNRVAILFALFTVTSPVRVFADSAVAVGQAGQDRLGRTGWPVTMVADSCKMSRVRC